MKKKKFAYLWVCICGGVFSTLASCSDVETDDVSSDIESLSLSSEVVEKMAYGCDPSSYEMRGAEKIETTASEEYMELIRERMLQKASNKACGLEQYVGVIKVTDCGRYNEVRVFYDCEDNNSSTRSKGFKGAWDVNTNINMRYCLVPVTEFKRTDKWYGVVNFSSKKVVKDDNENADVALISVYMDSQDGKNPLTRIYYTEHNEKEVQISGKGNMELVGNYNLSFEIFAFASKKGAVPNYPEFGFEYGVFGKLYKDDEETPAQNYYYSNDQGYVISDDEDTNNSNSITALFENKYVEVPKDKSYHGTVISNKNTTFFISKIKASM